MLVQNVSSWICPVAFKNGGVNAPWAVKEPLAWTLSGPLPTSEKAQCYSVCSMSQDEKLTAVVKQWWDVEYYGTVVSVDIQSSEDKQVLSHINTTIQNKDRRYRVGHLGNGQQKNLQNYYSAALSQLKSLETRLGKDENLKGRYPETIENDLKKEYVSKLETKDNVSITLC